MKQNSNQLVSLLEVLPPMSEEVNSVVMSVQDMDLQQFHLTDDGDVSDMCDLYSSFLVHILMNT